MKIWAVEVSSASRECTAAVCSVLTNRTRHRRAVLESECTQATADTHASSMYTHVTARVHTHTSTKPTQGGLKPLSDDDEASAANKVRICTHTHTYARTRRAHKHTTFIHTTVSDLHSVLSKSYTESPLTSGLPVLTHHTPCIPPSKRLEQTHALCSRRLSLRRRRLPRLR